MHIHPLVPGRSSFIFPSAAVPMTAALRPMSGGAALVAVQQPAVIAVPVAAAAAVAVPAGPTNGGYAHSDADLRENDTASPAGEDGSGSLAAVAKAAALKAERAAIEQTLRQVHWNRRKAAVNLGVSYKTLLNKIKECGISRV